MNFGVSTLGKARRDPDLGSGASIALPQNGSTSMHRVSHLLLAPIVLLSSAATAAEADTSTLDAYRRAQNFLPWAIEGNVHNNTIAHNWITGGNNLWYRRSFDDGHEFIRADAVRKIRVRAFDHDRMARALSKALGREVRADQLPIDKLVYESASATPAVVVEDKTWACDLRRLICAGRAETTATPGELAIPGRQQSLFLKDHNLWLRDLETGQSRPLTADGDHQRSYAILPEASTFEITLRRTGERLPPIGIFSPDGKKFITYRLDQSKVKPLHLLQNIPEDGTVRPIVHEYRYAFPGEDEAMAEFVIFDLENGEPTWVDHAPVAAPSEGPIVAGQVSWSADSRKSYLIEQDRSYRTLSLTEIDSQSGGTRALRSETENVNYLPALVAGDPLLVRVLNNGDIIWPSERSGTLHLYRYDGRTGTLRNAVTSGSWMVREIIRIDEAAGTLYFSAVGEEASANPYYRSLWRVNLDGTGLTRLTRGDADHQVRVPLDPFSALLSGLAPPTPETAGFSSDGDYFVDSHSTPDQPTVTAIRDARGNTVLNLETAALGAAIKSYVAPESFRVMAADGKTPIYGVLMKPSNFDPSKRYPLINSVYPGPQITRTPTRYLEDWASAQAVAELGFVVMTIDGRGTPMRSKDFRSFSYGNMGSAGGVEDHVAAIRQLTTSRPWLDGANVGIYGSSGGGFAAVRALFDYPDVFKVGFASAGNHDQRAYISVWGENYHGPFDNKGYESITSYHNVANFKGKLMLIHGDMDDNVHPANTMRLVDQLIKNNKSFEMLTLPNVEHNIMHDSYAIKRMWDYFIVNLKDANPPVDFIIPKPK